VKTLSATSDYVNAENRGDRDQRELRHLVALCQDFRKDAPPTGAHVTTLVGPGTVVGHNVRPTRWWVKLAADGPRPNEPYRDPTARCWIPSRT